MPDRRRIVRIYPYIESSITVVKDLADSANFYAVRDSFAVKPPKRTTIMAQRQRRYSGALPTAESHENAAITWQALVRGSSADAVNANVEAMLGVLETANLTNLHFEWRPDGATSSTYYEIRGPATWQLTYRPLQYTSTKSVVVDIEIPVAPLAEGDMAIQRLPAGYLPATLTRLPNSSFEYQDSASELYGWDMNGSMSSKSLIRTSAWSNSGPYSALVTGTSTGTNQSVYMALDTTQGTLMQVTPGRSYTCSVYAYVYTALAGANANVVIGWYDAFTNAISQSVGTSVSAATAGGKDKISVTGTAPAGAVSAQVFFSAQNTTTTGTLAVAFDDAYWSAGVYVAGTAPCLADFQVQMYGTQPVWAMVAWHPKIPQLNVGVVDAPFGLFPAASGDGFFSGWTQTSDANYRSGLGVRAPTGGAGSANRTWGFKPAVMQPDDFTRQTIDIEVWARVELDSTVVSPKIEIDAVADHYFNRGGYVQYTAEYGSAGKLLTAPSSGRAYRMVRLGVLTFSTDPLAEWQYIRLNASWGAGSSGAFGLDYIICVPARSRAVSPTGLALDSSYPKFFPATANTYLLKVVRSDLSGGLSYGGRIPPTTSAGPGFGGSPLELPPGELDVFYAMDTQVPDDPTVNTASSSDGMQWFVDLAGPRFYVTPRYNLAAS